MYIYKCSIVAFFFLFFSQCAVNPNSNKLLKEKAKDIYLEQLSNLEKYLESPKNDSSLQVVNIIYFFENLTGIPPEADGTFVGRLSASSSDFEKWRNWYIQNKSTLIWDDKNSRIIINYSAERDEAEK